MLFTITALSGRLITHVACDESADVSLLKGMICKTVGGRPCLTKLLVNGTVLDDVVQLKDVPITSDTQVVMLRESAAHLSRMPDFCGVYRGEVSEHGGRYLTEMVIDSAEFVEVAVADSSDVDAHFEGKIHWRPLRHKEFSAIGARGVEYVKGTVICEDLIEFVGYRMEYVGRESRGINLVCSNFTLRLQPSGESFTCEFVGEECGQGDYVIDRLTELEAEEWRINLEIDAAKPRRKDTEAPSFVQGALGPIIDYTIEKFAKDNADLYPDWWKCSLDGNDWKVLADCAKDALPDTGNFFHAFSSGEVGKILDLVMLGCHEVCFRKHRADRVFTAERFKKVLAGARV
mmetsp:Transcript_138268/g.275621  ORF Transcript_138268/g.275621 Transcript_138268/m.275621 type:complete len:346 (-) Transcript_138268:102-1139(-)